MSDTRTIAELARHSGPTWNADEAAYNCGCGEAIDPGKGAPIRAGITVMDWRMAEHRLAQIAPPAASIAVPHTPEEIWAAFDVLCDLGFFKRTDLEYTDDGVHHIKSGVNVTPDDQHMPDELRPDIGEDRVDAED